MRSLSAACAVLAVCALAGVTSPAQAAPVIFNDVISGGLTGTLLTVGGTSSYTFTHDITAAFNPATDTNSKRNPDHRRLRSASGRRRAGANQVRFGLLYRFDPRRQHRGSRSIDFTLGNIYGGVDILSDLQADGRLSVTLQVLQQGRGHGVGPCF